MLLGSTRKIRKVDRGNDFNDCCLIPITNTCRVLVLDPTDFTALFLFVFQLTVSCYIHRQSPTGLSYHASLERTAYHRDTREIPLVPSFLHCTDQLLEILGAVPLPASSVSAYYRNISVVIICCSPLIERVD